MACNRSLAFCNVALVADVPFAVYITFSRSYSGFVERWLPCHDSERRDKQATRYPCTPGVCNLTPPAHRFLHQLLKILPSFKDLPQLRPVLWPTEIVVSCPQQHRFALPLAERLQCRPRQINCLHFQPMTATRIWQSAAGTASSVDSCKPCLSPGRKAVLSVVCGVNVTASASGGLSTTLFLRRQQGSARKFTQQRGTCTTSSSSKSTVQGLHSVARLTVTCTARAITGEQRSQPDSAVLDEANLLCLLAEFL